jgi:TolB-like protein
MESGLPKAVFLSYAREDTAAAQRIAEALRSHGVEVWFDQNELRGGDAWDAKIRKQIRECALFMPVISAHTQARGEGYFRLEWKLAVERTHLMAEGMPFLSPVVIDATPDAGAVVPGEFMRVQWTRLTGGLPTSQFVEQAKRLLAEPSVAASAHKAEPRGAPLSPAARARSGLPIWISIALGALVLGLGAYFLLRPATKEAPVATLQAATEPKTAPAAPASLPADKSIAVLPFENMSEDKANAYFCDGVQEDILTDLANIAELRVVSRTSVGQYRGTTKPIREIARELGVAWILEGSVQRAGNKVRVTGQLINATTDEHKWAKAYDRDLSDIFAIQSELAQTIAASLQAELSPQEKALVDRKPTASLAAYDLLLKARQIRLAGAVSSEKRNENQHLLEQAVQLDPNLVGAWADLSNSYSVHYLLSIHTPEMLAKAHSALDIAKRLAPDDPTVMIAESTYYLNCFHDYTQARACLKAVAKRWPNQNNYGNLATVESHEGNWADALADYRRSAKLDPRTQTIRLAEELCYARRYGEAAKVAQEALAMSPDDLSMGYLAAYVAYIATGDPGPMTDWFGSVPARRRSEMDFKKSQANWAWTRGDAAEYVRLRRAMAAPDNPPESEPAFVFALSVATSREQVRGLMEQVVSKNVYAIGTAGWSWGSQTQELAFLGQISAASDAFNSYDEDQKNRAVDQRYAGANAGTRALQLAALGRKDEAFGEVARMLSLPSAYWFSVTVLRHSLGWKDLQGDPRFEALLNDPKNKEPLF